MYREMFKQLLLQDGNRGKSPNKYCIVASSKMLKGLSNELQVDRQISYNEIPEWLRGSIDEPTNTYNNSTPKTLYGYDILIAESCEEPCFMEKSRQPLPFDELPITGKSLRDGFYKL